jgi:hypothetical protein
VTTKPKSPIAAYRELMKRQREIQKAVDKLKEKAVKNGFKILKLVLKHAEVKKLHQSR